MQVDAAVHESDEMFDGLWKESSRGTIGISAYDLPIRRILSLEREN